MHRHPCGVHPSFGFFAVRHNTNRGRRRQGLAAGALAAFLGCRTGLVIKPTKPAGAALISRGGPFAPRHALAGPTGGCCSGTGYTQISSTTCVTQYGVYKGDGTPGALKYRGQSFVTRKRRR